MIAFGQNTLASMTCKPGRYKITVLIGRFFVPQERNHMTIHTERDLSQAPVFEEIPETDPLENLRYYVGVVDGLPSDTQEEESRWNVRRRIVDAYGADVLGTISVEQLTSIKSLDVEHFEDNTQHGDIMTYYRALSRSRERLEREYTTRSRIVQIARGLFRRSVSPLMI